MMKKPCYSVWF